MRKQEYKKGGVTKLKITRVEVFPVTIPKNENLPGGKKGLNTTLGSWEVFRFVIVKVFSDEGVVGFGESPPWISVSREGQSSIVSIIKDYLAPIVIGKDPFKIEYIWSEMDRICPGNTMAKTALDIALYDIIAKVFNTPIYNLLGGKTREKVPLAGMVGFDTLDNMVKLGEWWVKSGYNTIRFKIGMGLEKDVELIKTARKALGDKVKIRVDANQKYKPHEAIKIIRRLEEYNIEAVEQPIAWFDLKGLSLINKSVHTPIMPHESLYDIYDVVRLIDYDAASLFGLKLDRPGGITNAKKAIALAELYNIPCTVISSMELGVSTSASMQLAATLRSMDFACEASGSIFIADDIVKEGIEIDNGFARVSDKVGVGVELDEKKLKKYSESVIICDEDSELKS